MNYNILRVTPNELQTLSSKFLFAYRDQMEVLEKVSSLAEKLNRSWEGESSGRIVQQIRHEVAESARLAELLRKTAEDLNKLAAEYQGVERGYLNGD